MTIEELLQSLQQLIPELTEEQLTQIAAVLRLGMGEPVDMTGEGAVSEEVVSAIEAAGGEVTEEIRSHFGLVTYVDPYKAAASLDEILAVIQNVVTLTDEQLEKVMAILQLALASAIAEEEIVPLEEEMPLEEEVGPLAGEEMVVGEEEIRSIVEDAVYGVMGSS